MVKASPEVKNAIAAKTPNILKRPAGASRTLHTSPSNGLLKRPAGPPSLRGRDPLHPGRRSRTIHLIDALPYFFRAYFAIPISVEDPAGRPSNGVVGFANFLLKYVADEAPTHMALCWDRSLTASFRNELYPAYKSNRPLPPPELSDQIRRCRALTEALGIACFDDERYEADDLLGTLAAGLVKDGCCCRVVSSDKDLCQLVGPNVLLHDYGKGESYDQKGVQKRLGVRPEQVADYLGLAGDSVDNIPGVKGIGSKTAVALLAKFRDMDAIYAGLDRVAKLPLRGAQGIAARLAEDRSMAFLSRKLATVALNVPMRGRSLKALKRRKPKGMELDAILEDTGLVRLRQRVDALP